MKTFTCNKHSGVRIEFDYGLDGKGNCSLCTLQEQINEYLCLKKEIESLQSQKEDLEMEITSLEEVIEELEDKQ